MKMSTGIGLATVLSLAAALCGAEPAHRMKVLITPGAMSEAVGKGEVAIEISVSEIDVPAGAPLLLLNTMVSRPKQAADRRGPHGEGLSWPGASGIAKSGRQQAVDFRSRRERRVGYQVSRTG
jgi:hypothetical protein